MQAIRDIFELWPTITSLAKAIDARPDTVRKWKKFGRIPQESWAAVILAVAAKGQRLTADQLLEMNAPMKPRGRRLGGGATSPDLNR